MSLNLKMQQIFKARLPRHARALILTHLLLTQDGERVFSGKQIRERSNLRFSKYKNYRMLIRLRMWCMTNQANSLIEAHYSREPRDPE